MEDFMELMDKIKFGEILEFEVLRNGEKISVELIFVEYLDRLGKGFIGI